MCTVIILLFFIQTVFGQRKEPVKLTVEHTRLKQARDIHDILTDLAPDCRIIRFDLTYKSQGRVLTVSDIYADTLKDKNHWRDYLAGAEINSAIYLDVKRTDCKTLVGRVYSILVVSSDE